MSKLDEIIKKIDGNKRKPTKEELASLIRESLSEIKQLHEKYVEYFEGSDDSSAILDEIDSMLTATRGAFNKLFPTGATDTSLIDEIDTKLEEIRTYHKELIDSDESIKEDISEFQEKITEFYNVLFSNESEDGVKKQIIDFHTLLTKTGGIEEEVNQKSAEITAKYDNLFVAPRGKTTSKIEDFENSIIKIDEYKKDFEDTVNPDIKKRQQEIEAISKDIKVKQTEVSSLLSGATANTLAESYSESKCEYSSSKRRNNAKKWYSKISQFTYNNIGRHGSSILNYALFILPLLGILLIFTTPYAAKIIASNFELTNMKASPLEVLYSKTIVSLPLLWLAWFGQSNISKRKRLFEEYNHKLRVVQMYIYFTTNQTYKLDKDQKANLDKTLLDAIGFNPSQFLGKGETYVDKAKNLVSRDKSGGGVSSND